MLILDRDTYLTIVLFFSVGHPDTWDAANRLLPSKAHFVSCATHALKPLQMGDIASLGARVVGRKVLYSVGAGPNSDVVNVEAKRETLETVMGMVERGEIKPVIDRTYMVSNTVIELGNALIALDSFCEVDSNSL